MPRWALVVLSGLERGRERPVTGDVFRIGKSEDNDLVLLDETVSRAHCEITRDTLGYRIRDLASTNGTLLDGVPIEEARLEPGAVITVGKVELKVRPFAELVPSDRTRYGELVGSSPAMRRVFGLLERLGPTDATVLLEGEPGTGKGALARSVHAESSRAEGPFVVVDCRAGARVGRELFGEDDAESASPGTRATRGGAFERAYGGTLVLDEIGELPLELQPRLLRALAQRAAGRAEVRIVAASSRDLRVEVEQGRFREDLFSRLAVVPIELPPLRARRDDLPLLVETLLGRLAEVDPAAPRRLHPSALDALRAHDWPGNVRELRDVLEGAARLAREAGRDELSAAMMPFGGAGAAERTDLPAFDSGKSFRESKAEWEALFERRYVAWLLERCGGNLSAAARAADMDRKHLYKLACRHGLHPAKR